jgi:hypothetical protein
MERSIPTEKFYLELYEDDLLDMETAEDSLEALKYQ